MVYCAIQDDRGYMWFGTDNGVSQFDGREFKNFTKTDGLPDNEALDFFKDSQGRIWIFTLNGKVGFIDGDSIYNSEKLAYLKPLDSDVMISNILEYDSAIYFSGDRSIKYFKGNEATVKELEEWIAEYSYAFVIGDSLYHYFNDSAAFSRGSHCDICQFHVTIAVGVS